MAESITISPTPPEQKSMQYETLRAAGLKHIQKLAAKVWTDYNLSDPGISILEVLSYVITDLGYRISYDMPDLLAQDPNGPQTDIKNFYTAREILPMRPVTFDDYRKLMIDVEVHDQFDTLNPLAGVKNAWIEKSPTNEVPVYLNKLTDSLQYTPVDPNNPEKLDIRVLYDILLEFDHTENLGDLNANTLEQRIKLYPCSDPMLAPIDPKMIGVSVKLDLEFPRWDDEGIDWNDSQSIIQHMKNVVLDFSNMPSGYKVQGFGFDNAKDIWVDITNGNNNTQVDTGCIAAQLNAIYRYNTVNLVTKYQEKIRKVQQIVEAVRAKLMDNRNLCEDFFRINALRIEEIALCADIQVATNADIEKIEAEMYFRIGNFLSPTVYFYTLDQMFEKGLTSEQIFEGPALDHGFIDHNELKKADRRKSIHVSDLIQIIMDIPGVLAVKSIQIANIPLDNDFNIPSVSVKWCLQLAFDKNYVPRLTTERSSITFFKDLLPFHANDEEVDAILQDLVKEQRPQKLHNIPLDIPVPEGTFRNIEEYVSVQDEFPLTYGIGPEGLPASSGTLRKAQQRQLKGFLMHFDQLLANYMSQLSHVKDLFSMNGETNFAGDFVIDKSYFSQSLAPYVTDSTNLLIQPAYNNNLQPFTESESLFEERRNRFLDHLMARFCEQFTDYAMLVYKMDGPKAPNELLVDKLRLLNDYPDISSGRFRAFDYESPCELWHIDNTSGLEKRISLLTGIDERKPSSLIYEMPYEITGTGPYGYAIPDNTTPLITSFNTYATTDEVMLALEELIINGINNEKYKVVDSTGRIWDPNKTGYAPDFRRAITCGEHTLAWDNRITEQYSDPFACEVTLAAFMAQFIADFENEYYNNPESNRNNLACPLESYYDTTTVSVNMVPDPPYYTFDFTLYQSPFNFGPPNVELLTGTWKAYGDCKSSTPIINVDPTGPSITVNGDLSPYIKNTAPDDWVTISGSVSNDDDYQVILVTVNEPLPDVFETVITFDPSVTLNPGLPFGSLQYNKQSGSELTQIGIDAVPYALFDISFRGINRANYTLPEPTITNPDYHFNIVDKCGDVIATSVEIDFNNALAAAIQLHNGMSPPQDKEIDIINSTDNNGTYTVISAVAIGAEIKIEVAPGTLTSQIADGQIVLLEAGYNITAVDQDKHMFTINSADLSRKLFAGDGFSVIGSTGNNGNYSIRDIYKSGVNTIVIVEEQLPSAIADGDLTYAKQIPITRIDIPLSGNELIYVKGGADEYAIKQMIDFLKLKFFSHEGLHIVEHVLLRPKHNGKFFIDFTEGAKELAPTPATPGTFTFTKKLPVYAIDQPSNAFIVQGNLMSELTAFQSIIITGSTSGINDGTYTVLTFGYDPGFNLTGIKVSQEIPDPLIAGMGEFNFKDSIPVTSNTTTSVLVSVPDVEIAAQYNVSISGSTNGENDGNYIIDTVSGFPNATVTLKSRETFIQDDLMQVNLLADCETCVYEDPYSFLATAIMPAWQGRFINTDFRTFFERSLRLECPAHLMLNICWIDCEHMKEFERAWKKWILENSKKDKNQLVLSASLNAVIAILKKLRSSFPKGTLHDCELDDTLTNAIILNKTIIGTT
ncbi:MAG TPA: hypothetical protein VK177_06605 [Flavobacteriales bacterium]|nr:hypothetical protein [Flavobacteriales bacterium]